MDELVAKVAEATGIDPATARKAVVIILQFLVNAGPKDKVDALVDQLPGARAAIGNGGGGPSDMMGAFSALTGAGLGMGQIQSVAHGLRQGRPRACRRRDRRSGHLQHSRTEPVRLSAQSVICP